MGPDAGPSLYFLYLCTSTAREAQLNLKDMLEMLVVNWHMNPEISISGPCP